MQIITGYTGTPHITALQDREANQGSYGTASYILDVGNKMNATIISANEVRIDYGALSHQGCLGNIDRGLYESLAISNGTHGMKRSDLIVCRYTKEAETNIENLELVVIEGTPAASNPSDPPYNTGNIQYGASPVDFPLYRVNINGITISSVTRIAPYVRTQAEMDTLLGDTSISSIGNGTVTGAISTMNAKTTQNLNANWLNMNCVRTGNGAKFIRCSTPPNAAMTGGTEYNVGTLQTEFRPAYNIFHICKWGGASNAFGILKITREGAVTFTPDINVPISTGISICLAFI